MHSQLEASGRHDKTQWLVWIAFLDALLGFVVITVGSDDILGRHSWLNGYVQLIGHIFPLEQYVSRSPFGDVARLYNAIVWPALPVHFALLWTWFRKSEGRPEARYDAPLFRVKPRLTVANRILLAVLAPVFLILGVGALLYWHGGDTRLVHFGTSRMQLAVLGILGPVSSATGLSLGCAALKKALFGRI
jgi:hypothetical protein